MIFVEGYDGCPAEIAETAVVVMRFVGKDGEGDLSEAFMAFDDKTAERLINDLGQLLPQIKPPEDAA